MEFEGWQVACAPGDLACKLHYDIYTTSLQLELNVISPNQRVLTSLEDTVFYFEYKVPEYIS